jgi:small subunit ribosomal protein S4
VRKPGKTGENLLQILESRLDNVVYRAGLARTRRMARQLVSHGHFTVNGVKVNIPSYRVAQYDIVDVKDKSLNTDPFIIARRPPVIVRSVLAAGRRRSSAHPRAPIAERAQIQVPLQEQLIVGSTQVIASNPQRHQIAGAERRN